MKKLFCVLLLITLLGGCATIVGDKMQLVPIYSTPSDASVLIQMKKEFSFSKV